MIERTCGKTGLFFGQAFMGALPGLILSPRRWFSEIFPLTTQGEALGLLFLSSFFYAAAGAMPASGGGNILPGAILMVNALGMTVLCAAIAWFVIAIGSRQHIRFSLVLRVFAYGASPVLLIAWVPFSFFFTEPWKWVLVGMGLVYGLGMGKRSTVATLLITASLTVVLFLTILRLMV